VQNPIRITHFGYHIKGPVENKWFKKEWDCFDVHKDIVAAPYDSFSLKDPHKPLAWPPLRSLLQNKTRLFMYRWDAAAAPAAAGSGAGARAKCEDWGAPGAGVTACRLTSGHMHGCSCTLVVAFIVCAYYYHGGRCRCR
jgi:hypothetical protein